MPASDTALGIGYGHVQVGAVRAQRARQSDDLQWTVQHGFGLGTSQPQTRMREAADATNHEANTEKGGVRFQCSAQVLSGR